jgi:hypothetical protein
VRLRTALPFGAAGAIGAVVGTELNRLISGQALLLAFALLLLVDFFFNQSAPETEFFWGHDETLGRITRIIRMDAAGHLHRLHADARRRPRQPPVGRADDLGPRSVTLRPVLLNSERPRKPSQSASPASLP